MGWYVHYLSHPERKMTIEEAKRILWDDWKTMSDKEIQLVIDLIQSIVQIEIEDYLSEKKLAN